MAEEKALVPVEQKRVTFYEDEVTAVLIKAEDHNRIFVPIRSICEYLGISWNGQRERIRRDPVLSGAAVSARVTRAESKRGYRDMLCLPLEFLNGWLFGISVNRLRVEGREQLLT